MRVASLNVHAYCLGLQKVFGEVKPKAKTLRHFTESVKKCDDQLSKFSISVK